MFNEVENLRSYKQWQLAYICSQKNDKIKLADNIFFKIYSMKRKDGRFLITYANLKYKEGNKKEALNLMIKSKKYFCDIKSSINMAKMYKDLGCFKEAENQYILSEHMAPDRIITSYNRFLFYIDTNNYFSAYELSKKIVNRPIKDKENINLYIIKSKLNKFINLYENK